MSDEIVSRRVTVTNSLGMHARPAERFARLAGQFDAKIEVVKGDYRVEGKSILEVLTLAAEKGTELIIEAAGEDAQAAVDALAKLVESDFAEDETKTDNHA